MTKLAWTDALSVGIDLVDQQHQRWIGHFNSAVEAIEASLGKDHIIKNLSFLVDYTATHFSSEEQHMAANAYPAMAEHKSKHDDLRQTLADLVRDFEEEGATQPLADAVETFLGNWLIQHIQRVDMAFGAFLREKGVKIPS